MNVQSAPANPLVLGKAIAKARRACGLTQQELCKQTGVAYSTLTKIERGAIKKPNVFTVLQIAQATDLKVEELLRNSASTAIVNPYTAATATYSAPAEPRASKRGVKFVYFDLHQVLVYSSMGAIPFTAAACGQPAQKVEELYLRYTADLCLGRLSMEDFNQILSRELQTPHLDWQDFYLRHVRPDAEVRAGFDWASRHYRVGLLTNAFPGNVSGLMERGTIPGEYAAVVDSSVIGQLKPHRGIYEYAQKQAGVSPDEILLIDDRLVNIASAQACGWQGFWLNAETRPGFASRLQNLLGF